MPKINAATVAEHRARQRAALLDAARDLLLEGGYAALSFGALAERTGLARPTVYSYFRTKDDVVIALCQVELPKVAADTQRAVRQAPAPREGIAAFVRAQLRVAQQPRYRVVHALATAALPDEVRQRILELHRAEMPTAVPLFVALGHPHPALAATLLQGLINAAVMAIAAGEPPRRVSQATIAAALDGLAPRGDDARGDDPSPPDGGLAPAAPPAPA